MKKTERLDQTISLSLNFALFGIEIYIYFKKYKNMKFNVTKLYVNLVDIHDTLLILQVYSTDIDNKLQLSLESTFCETSTNFN